MLTEEPNNFSEEKARQIGFGYLDNFMGSIQQEPEKGGLKFEDL